MADAKLSALSVVSAPALADPVYGEQSGTSFGYTLTRLLGLLNGTCQGRLTLTTLTPVTTSDVTGATTVYFTPYGGQCVAVYDGTRWRLYTFSEISLALGTLVNASNYDVFLYDNSGTLTLILGPAWTSDTARGTGAGTTELVLQDGVYVNKVSISGGPAAKAGRYLGTLRTTATTTTEDSAAKRFVWNAANRRPRELARKESAASWTYATANTWRQANANTANKVELLIGLSEDAVRLGLMGVSTGDGSSQAAAVSVGLDSTTSPAADDRHYYSSNGPGGIVMPASAIYYGFPGLGYHYLAWLEQVTGATITFYSEDANIFRRTGLVGDCWA